MVSFISAITMAVVLGLCGATSVNAAEMAAPAPATTDIQAPAREDVKASNVLVEQEEEDDAAFGDPEDEKISSQHTFSLEDENDAEDEAEDLD